MKGGYFFVGNDSSVLPFDHRAHNLENIYVRAGLILVYSIIFLISFLGNLAVILVVTLQWKARPLSKFYLGNMAAASQSVAVFCIPQNLTLGLLDKWIFGELMCRLFHFVPSLCHTASILTLIVVSVERYVTIIHSIKGGQVLTVRRLQVMMLLVWLLSTGVSLPQCFYCGLIRTPLDGKGTSREICPPKKFVYNSATEDIIYSVVFYALPLAVMSVMCVRIGECIQKSEKMASVQAESTFPDTSGNSYDAGRRGTIVTTHVAPCTSLASATSSSVVLTFHGQRVTAKNKKGVGTKRQSNQQVENLVSSTQIPARRFQLANTSNRLLSQDSSYVNYEATLCASAKLNNGSEKSRPEFHRGRPRLTRVQCHKRDDVVRMLKYNVVSFVLLNLPFHLHTFCVNLFPSLIMSSDVNNFMTTLSFVLMYAYCALNPMMYFAMSRWLRGSMRDLIRKFLGASSRSPVYL